MNLGDSLRNYIMSMRAVWRDHSVFMRHTKQIERGVKDIGTSSKRSSTYMGDLQRAMRRVAVVLPVWMAARAALRTFTNTVRDSVDYLVKMDKALARAKATITGYAGSMNSAGEAIRNNARALAMVTGRPIEKIIEIFYRLSTAGIGFKQSLAGMSGVLKTTIAMMGDEEQVAKVLAQTYNLLGKKFPVQSILLDGIPIN